MRIISIHHSDDFNQQELEDFVRTHRLECEELQLDDTTTHDFSFLANIQLPQLRSLSLRSTRVTKIPHIPAEQLIHLQLNETAIVDFSLLPKFSQLRLFSAHNNYYPINLNYLPKNIQALDLSESKISHWDQLNKLRALQRLDLSNTNFSATKFINSRRLEHLKLDYTNAYDFSPLIKLNIKSLSICGLQCHYSRLMILSDLSSLETLEVSKNNPEFLWAKQQIEKSTLSIRTENRSIDETKSLEKLENFTRNKKKTEAKVLIKIIKDHLPSRFGGIKLFQNPYYLGANEAKKIIQALLKMRQLSYQLDLTQAMLKKYSSAPKNLFKHAWQIGKIILAYAENQSDPSHLLNEPVILTDNNLTLAATAAAIYKKLPTYYTKLGENQNRHYIPKKDGEDILSSLLEQKSAADTAGIEEGMAKL